MSCPTGKKGFVSEDKAGKHLKWLRREANGSVSSIHLTTYCCDECRDWHLGSELSPSKDGYKNKDWNAVRGSREDIFNYEED